MTLHNIKLLRSILNDSLDAIEAAYESKSLSFPSLDDPYDGGSEAEQFATDPDIARTLDLITSASYQLLCTVRHPFLSLADASNAFHLSSCIRIAEKFNIPEVLREAGPHGMHVDKIAAKVNVEPTKLARILRLLATHHIFREMEPDIFANNRISSYFDTDKPSEELISNPDSKYQTPSTGNGVAAAGYIGTFTDEVFKSSSYLSEVLENEAIGKSFLASEAAFQQALSTNQIYFEWLENSHNAYRFVRYGACIQGTSLWDPPATILQGYDWESISQGGVIVDVGGGLGAPAMVLAREYPEIRIILEDREHVVSQGKAHWMKVFPDAVTSGRVSFKAHDFFTPQPIIGPDVFLVRTICHDWPDDLVVDILRHLRAAAKDSTRLILADYIMLHACPTHDTADGLGHRLVPYPLLTNLGKASFNAYFIDMTMQVLLNGQERTLTHQSHLAGMAGWKIVQVIRVPNSQFGYLVAEPLLEDSESNI